MDVNIFFFYKEFRQSNKSTDVWRGALYFQKDSMSTEDFLEYTVLTTKECE
jgi:hypothetical protein